MDEKRGLSSHHIQNYFSANFTYEFPVGQKLSGFASRLVSGWQINGILTLSDGYPLSITDRSDNQEDIIGDTEELRVNLIPGGNNNPVLGGPDQYYDVNQFLPSRLGFFGTLGRNTLISPGLATFDFSLFRDFSVGEERRIQFRAEFFNLFNRSNFGEPDTRPFESNTADFLGAGGDGKGTIIRSGSAGRIFRTITKAREIQFGLKFIF